LKFINNRSKATLSKKVVQSQNIEHCKQRKKFVTRAGR